MKKQCHVLDKKIDTLRQLYQSDLPMVQIAKRLGVGKTTLEYKIRELGWQRKPRLKKTSINKQKLQELIRLGLSDRKIQEKLHIGRCVLFRYKKELGLYNADQKKVASGKKGSANRAYYKQTGELAECPYLTNVLEKYQAEIIPLLEQGTPKTEIAKQYNVSLSTVFNFIHLYGLKAPIKKVCDNQDQLITQAFQEGKSLEDIAKQLHCCPATIQRKVKEIQLNRPKNTVMKKSFLNDRKAVVQKLYEQGLSGAEMSEKLGISPQNIYQSIKRFQLTRPQKWAEYRSTFKGHDEELLQMRQSGMTLKQIGEHFGVRDNTVFYRLRKLEGANA